MTNLEKRELRQMVKSGMSFSEILPWVECSDATIRRYLKVFAPRADKET